jgi:hypothetical protein
LIKSPIVAIPIARARLLDILDAKLRFASWDVEPYSMRIIYFILTIVFASLVARPAMATSCNEDCHDRCRRCALGVCAIEPVCHAQCEIEKKAACAIQTPVPHIPGPSDIDPTDPGKSLRTQCKIPFENYVNATIAACANWAGRDDDLEQIQWAKNVLIGTNLIGANEFNGVDIRWCPLGGMASGMTPAKDRVLLNPNLKGNTAEIAITLGHEMTHIRQYRRWDTDDFECRYSQQLVSNGTGRGNSVENEAYAFQDQITPIIQQAFQTQQQPPMPAQFQMSNRCATPYGICQLMQATRIGSGCFCNGPPPSGGQIVP